MKKTLLLALLATVATATAGTSMVSAGKGKGSSAGPGPQPAECPNYLTYNEVQLSYVHLDGADAGSADGVDLRINKDIAQGIFAYGDLSAVTGDIDNTSLDLGVGAYIPLCTRFHVIGRGGFSYFDGDSDSSVGWHVAAGLRTQLTCELELNAKVQYGDLTDFEEGDYVSWGVGATYHLSERLAILGEYVFGEDDTWSVRGGVAYKF